MSWLWGSSKWLYTTYIQRRCERNTMMHLAGPMQSKSSRLLIGRHDCAFSQEVKRAFSARDKGRSKRLRTICMLLAFVNLPWHAVQLERFRHKPQVPAGAEQSSRRVIAPPGGCSWSCNGRPHIHLARTCSWESAIHILLRSHTSRWSRDWRESSEYASHLCRRD